MRQRGRVLGITICISRWSTEQVHSDPDNFGRETVPSAVHRRTDLLLCFLIVGIHSTGILIPLSLQVDVVRLTSESLNQ